MLQETVWIVLAVQAVTLSIFFGARRFLRSRADNGEDADSVVVHYRDTAADVTFMGEITSTMDYVSFRNFLHSLSLAIGRAEVYCGNIGMRVYAQEVRPFVWMGDEDDLPEEALDDNLYILSLDDAETFLADAKESVEVAMERVQGSTLSRWMDRRRQNKINKDEDVENWWLSV